MLDKFKRLFAPVNSAQIKNADLRLAAAVLLVEVARADYSVEPAEESRLYDLLQRQFDLSGDEIIDLKTSAEDTADISISLHRHLDTINQAYSSEQKTGLLAMLWEMAYADGEIHHYEEHLIRRIADLLYIPHKDFIRTKHQVIRHQ